MICLYVQYIIPARQFAFDAIKSQKDEFRSWGILADWENSERLYFTFNPDFICNQLRLFSDFFKRGLIYRDLKPVYWSPSSRYWLLLYGIIN